MKCEKLLVLYLEISGTRNHTTHTYLGRIVFSVILIQLFGGRRGGKTLFHFNVFC